MTNKKLVLLLLTAVTVVGGYAFLRYAYGVTDSMPFTQEIVLIILGTVATVLITALLLNQQTAVEIEKEQSIKFIELKTKTYEELIDRIEAMSLVEQIDCQDLIRLRFIMHRLAIFSSPEVLNEFHNFLAVLTDCVANGTIQDNGTEISMALASLTIRIRQDLIGEMDDMGNYSQEHIKKLILRNSDESMALKISQTE
ncbi:hypothetical protein [methane-oxidizing endosymbiont of Gigantopelta aegis]|uniref:hypothetical protein n=1 Tax=methane-oxidizing endosymbiont of Gigantopelta aegis TaxID=2794938 RepID=UPI001FDAB74E|nr:hypothetical protein [methane-oxidizing endosymbiont of Gigantopelta aegis]